jgi:hypothetical protein
VQDWFHPLFPEEFSKRMQIFLVLMNGVIACAQHCCKACGEGEAVNLPAEEPA